MADEGNLQLMADEGSLRDSEVALMDTLKLLFEVVVAKGLSTSDTLSEALSRQASVYPPAAMPRARWIVAQFQASMNDPHRKALRELLARPVQGNA